MARLGAGAVSLSAAAHALVVGGILYASVFGRDSWPENAVAAAPRGPVVFDARPTPGPPPVRLPDRRPPTTPIQEPSLTEPAAASPAEAPIRNFEAVAEPQDLPAGTGLSGACTSGCVVGPIEPAGGEPKGSPGGEGGAEAVSAGPGGKVRAPAKLRDRSPVYPYLAIQARVEGRVDIECRIDASGRVVDAKVLHGHPLLAPAALDAVRQWAYTPTLLNGVPVSVIMTVTVHFHLRR